MDRIAHLIPPLYQKDSQLLILGSFPSVKSREAGFFYHHPQTRFWKVISTIYEEPLPSSVEEKRSLLLRNGIAVWDVISSCEITGSADSSIKNVIPNNISGILSESDIKHIYTNGSTATRLYRKYILPEIGIACVQLPSTSPANAGIRLEELIEAWACIRYEGDGLSKAP